MRNELQLIVLLAFSVAACSGQQGKATTGADPAILNLCEILKSPEAYIGKSISVIVSITSMKEGSTVWNPDCPKLGVALITTLERGPDSGIPYLRRELAQYQLASQPLSAKLSGVYVPDYFDEIRHRQYPVFKAYAAADVKRSPPVSHRR